MGEHDCFLSHTEFLLIPNENATPLKSNVNVRFSKAPRTALGRYVNLYIATPMHRSQLGVVMSRRKRRPLDNASQEPVRPLHSYSV